MDTMYSFAVNQTRNYDWIRLDLFEGSTGIKATVVATALVTLMDNNVKKSKEYRALSHGEAQVNLIVARIVKAEEWKT